MQRYADGVIPARTSVSDNSTRADNTMNTATTRLRAGDVIELEIDGEVVSALVLLANRETVIFDFCDDTMPCVARQEDLMNVRVFDGLAA